MEQRPSLFGDKPKNLKEASEKEEVARKKMRKLDYNTPEGKAAYNEYSAARSQSIDLERAAGYKDRQK